MEAEARKRNGQRAGAAKERPGLAIAQTDGRTAAKRRKRTLSLEAQDDKKLFLAAYANGMTVSEYVVHLLRTVGEYYVMQNRTAVGRGSGPGPASGESDPGAA